MFHIITHVPERYQTHSTPNRAAPSHDATRRFHPPTILEGTSSSEKGEVPGVQKYWTVLDPQIWCFCDGL